MKTKTKTKTRISVLDDGFVRLDSSMGDDLAIVNHARISLARHKDVMDVGDEKLISFLMKHRHGTPFEAVHLAFHVRCPIFVAREWMRHRMSSFNEISGRYVKMEMDFYTPYGDFIRRQEGKPGAYTFTPVYDPALEYAVRSEMQSAYEHSARSYQRILDMGIAKEVARDVLPFALYTEFYYDTNARSLMNFLSLRNTKSALKEIREYAIAIEQLFAKVAPVCYNAFVENGRVTP